MLLVLPVDLATGQAGGTGICARGPPNPRFFAARDQFNPAANCRMRPVIEIKRCRRRRCWGPVSGAGRGGVGHILGEGAAPKARPGFDNRLPPALAPAPASPS